MKGIKIFVFLISVSLVIIIFSKPKSIIQIKWIIDLHSRGKGWEELSFLSGS
jgi:hypothetical protein